MWMLWDLANLKHPKARMEMDVLPDVLSMLGPSRISYFQAFELEVVGFVNR
jgi:hypothetical protein